MATMTTDRAAGRLQEHDRPRAQRLPQGVRRGVRRHRRGARRGRRGRRRRRRRRRRRGRRGEGRVRRHPHRRRRQEDPGHQGGPRSLTSLGLKEAKDLVDGAPKPVLEKASRKTPRRPRPSSKRPAPGRAQVVTGATMALWCG